MWLGIDVGTSGVKGILVDERDTVLAQGGAPLAVSRPQPLWSEQAPQDWWAAVEATIDFLARIEPAAMHRVQAIGLSGQMLGVTLVDRVGAPLRPALLWNDGRAAAEGCALEREIADFAGVTGARAMPGFSAPKLRWLRDHEPQHLAAAHAILLPKDYVRFALSGELASDRADSSATLLMATASGTWHDAILAACGVSKSQLPRLVESGEIAGVVRPELCRRWGLRPALPIVGGAGDNMCGGVGAGVVKDGDSFISLGTSAVYFVANDRFVPSRGQGMHTHRHAVPGIYCQQAVVLSAAASLDWVAHLLGRELGPLIAEVEAANLSPDETPVFTPYLAGERTPHDDPTLTATMSRLGFASGPLHLVQAVLEGVALALADCRDALKATGVALQPPALVGGGTRSRLWPRLIASALGMPLRLAPQAAVGPALGAARLARAACGGPLIAAVESRAVEVVSQSHLADALARKRDSCRAHLQLRD